MQAPQPFDKQRFIEALDIDTDVEYRAENVDERDIEVKVREVPQSSSGSRLPRARVTVKIPREYCRKTTTSNLGDTGHDIAGKVRDALSQWNESRSIPGRTRLSFEYIENHSDAPERYVFEEEIQLESPRAS